MAFRPTSWLDVISCGGALMLAVLAGVHAAGKTLQELSPADATSAECRVADAAVLAQLRPLVIADRAIDPRIFRSALTSLDTARTSCRDGDNSAALAAYGHLHDNLSRFAKGGSWPLDDVPHVTAETLPPPRVTALRYFF